MGQVLIYFLAPAKQCEPFKPSQTLTLLIPREMLKDIKPAAEAAMDLFTRLTQVD